MNIKHLLIINWQVNLTDRFMRNLWFHLLLEVNWCWVQVKLQGLNWLTCAFGICSSIRDSMFFWVRVDDDHKQVDCQLMCQFVFGSKNKNNHHKNTSVMLGKFVYLCQVKPPCSKSKPPPLSTWSANWWPGDKGVCDGVTSLEPFRS